MMSSEGGSLSPREVSSPIDKYSHDYEGRRDKESLSSAPSSPASGSCRSPASPNRSGSPLIDPGEATDEEYYKNPATKTSSSPLVSPHKGHDPRHGPGSGSRPRKAANGLAIPHGLDPRPPPPAGGSGQNNSNKPLTSFLINDILSYKPKKQSISKQQTHESCKNSNKSSANPVGNIQHQNSSSGQKIVRPWDIEVTPAPRSVRRSSHQSISQYKDHEFMGSLNGFKRPRSADDDSLFEGSEEESECSESPPSSSGKSGSGLGLSSPLDALFEMTSKTLEGLNNNDKLAESGDHLNLFNNRQPPKKKRKSRTAFTNHQIFELEKRFLYQKYLSPADRDELAQSLGLTGAQVITWFQNRRAKLKRDMEELKKDMDAAKVNPAHKSLLDPQRVGCHVIKPHDLSLHSTLRTLSQSPL